MNVAAAKQDTAGGRTLERQNEPRGGGLPAPALADEPQRLPATQDEVDTVDRLHGARGAGEDRPPRQREVLRQPTRLEYDVASAVHVGASRIRHTR